MEKFVEGISLRTVNHNGTNPKTEGRAAKNIDVNARATFCLTYNVINTYLRQSYI